MATKEPKWHKVENVKDFLESRGQVSVGTHSARSYKRIPWPVCSRCGLLYLKNEATRKAINKPCIVEE